MPDEQQSEQPASEQPSEQPAAEHEQQVSEQPAPTVAEPSEPEPAAAIEPAQDSPVAPASPLDAGPSNSIDAQPDPGVAAGVTPTPDTIQPTSEAQDNPAAVITVGAPSHVNQNPLATDGQHELPSELAAASTAAASTDPAAAAPARYTSKQEFLADLDSIRATISGSSAASFPNTFAKIALEKLDLVVAKVNAGA